MKTLSVSLLMTALMGALSVASAEPPEDQTPPAASAANSVNVAPMPNFFKRLGRAYLDDWNPPASVTNAPHLRIVGIRRPSQTLRSLLTFGQLGEPYGSVTLTQRNIL